MSTTEVRQGLSLQFKVIAVVLVIVVLAIGVSVVGTIVQSSRQIASSQGNAIQMIASGVAQASELALVVGDTTELNRLIDRFLLIDTELSFIAVHDNDGRLVARAVRKDDHWQQYQQGGATTIRERFLIATQAIESIKQETGGEALFDGELFPFEEADAESQEGEQEQVIGQVIAAKSLAPLRQAQQAQAALVITAAGALIVAIIPVVYFMVGGWTRRLSRLVEASHQMASGKRSEPLEDDREDEVGTLVRSFEAMRLAVAQREEEHLRFNAKLRDEVQKRTAELEKAMHAAEEANRAKTEFLANMSHEIRTPMTSILGYAELMEEPNQSQEDRFECVQTINRNAGYLLSIINDILDISKIEAGKMTVECITCSTCNIVADVASLMRGRALEHGLDFSIEYRGPIPEYIRSDPTRLRQILMNISGNAIKFTKEGEVKITIELCNDDDSQSRLRFAVSDTGIGLTDEQIGRLFQPFSQADGSMTRRYGGTGLGLTISRRLAQLLSGEITVESEYGVGSTFTLEVPIGDLSDVAMIEPANEIEASVKSAERESASDVVVSLKGYRVLLAEDGSDNQRLIRFHVTKAGAEVDVAENGAVAMTKIAEASEQGKPYEVILMDMQMPVMDGYAATSRLRSEGYDRPIIALTAHAMSGDRERCLNAGCDDYTTKPINRLRLIRLIREWAEQVSTRSSMNEAPDRSHPSPRG